MIALRVKNLKTEMRENDKTGFLEPRLSPSTEFTTFDKKIYGIFPLMERII